MPDPRPGAIIDGTYELLAPLGEGGMGEVFEARHAVTGRLVAVKILKAEAKHRDEARRRFQREAQAIGRLEHPHVVEVLDAGIDADTGAPYIVQTLLRGLSLRTFLKTQVRIEPRLAARLVAPILRGLSAAHAAGIVHRDIKPTNVFLCRRDDDPRDEVVPKIIDFGISKLEEQGDAPDTISTLTASGVVVGTVGYMAPEQAEGRQDIDQRVDLWAVGVMLYEMIAGRRPFDAPSTTMTLLRIVSHDPPQLREVIPDVPGALSDVVSRALQRSPEARWPSAVAMLEALEAAIGEPLRSSSLVVPGACDAQAIEPTPERPASPRPAGAATAETAPARGSSGGARWPTTPVDRDRSASGGGALAVGAVIAVVSLVAAAAVISSRGDESSARPLADLEGATRDAGALPSDDDAGMTGTEELGGRDSSLVPEDAATEPPLDAGRRSIASAPTDDPSATRRRRAPDAAVLDREAPQVGAHGSPILGAD